MTEFEKLLPVLARHEVKFILVGGLAAIVHGASRATYDLDVVYARDAENLERLAKALSPYDPYLRGAPPGLPFRFDPETIRRGLNFTLTTSLGSLDLLGEITGGGSYRDLVPNSQEVEIFGVRCLCLGLRSLIQVKRAAGRPKDLEAVAELEAVLGESGKSESPS